MNFKEISQSSFLRLSLTSLVLVVILSICAGCSLFFQTPTEVKITIEEIESPLSNIGEQVEITWSYFEDGEPVRQDYTLVQHTILGGIREELELSNTDRDLSFVFQAPTTVFLRAYDSEEATEPISEVAIDILYDTRYFLEASVESVVPNVSDTIELAIAETATHNFPRLGYEDEEFSRKITFSNFVGIRDENIDNVIEFFKENAPSFDPNSPFRMMSFNRDQVNDFGAVAGSGFPKICHPESVPDDCHANITLPDTFANVSHANVIVFGGALAYGGVSEVIKTSDGPTTFYRNPQTQGERIFIAIALSSGLANTFTEDSGDLEIVDIFIGNVEQKLIINAFRGTSQSDAFLGNKSASYQNLTSEDPTISGTIKGAYIRDILNLATYEKFPLNFNFTDVEWQVPFRKDDNLLGIPTARFRCELADSCLESQ